MREVHSSELAH